MSETPNYITAAEARSHLPFLSYAMASNLLDRNGEHSDFEKMVCYTHYLVARGEMRDIIMYLDSLDDALRRDIVNTALYTTYFGNTLHACAYWNTGYDAIVIYRYLVNCGAEPCRDYYEQYPWEMDGVSYICPLRGRSVDPDSDRNFEEFAETYDEIVRYFPHTETAPPVDLPPLRPETPPYSWSEPAGGAGVGVGTAEENVHRFTDALLRIWGNTWDDTVPFRANFVANDLIFAITELETVSETQVAPWHRARKLLAVHMACVALNACLRTYMTSEDPYVQIGSGLRAAMHVVENCSFDEVDTTRFAIYRYASQLLAHRETPAT